MTTKLIDTLTGKLGPAIATPHTALDQINTALDIKSNSEVWEIGCGDARVLSHCANIHPNSNFIGIDNGIIMLARAKWRTRHQKNVNIRYGNLRSISLNGATNVYIYLLPETLGLIKPKIPKSCRVVSLEFSFPEIEPNTIVMLPKTTIFAHRLFIYKF